MAKRKRKQPARRRRSSSGRAPSRRKSSGMPSFVKTAGKVLVGALVGGVVQPLLPSPLHGPALGIAAAGLTSGFNARALPLVAIGGGLQLAQVVATTKPYMKLQAAVSTGAAAHGIRTAGASSNDIGSAISAGFNRNFGTFGRATSSAQDIASAAQLAAAVV